MEGLSAEAWAKWEGATPSSSSSATQSTFLGSIGPPSRHPRVREKVKVLSCGREGDGLCHGR